MNWTKEYIEARILDAMDGNLSNEDLQKLRTHLKDFPELGDLEEVLPSLEKPLQGSYSTKTLYKQFPFAPKAYESELGEDLEKMAIAKIEGLLNEKEEQDFDQTLKVESSLQQEISKIQQTVLKVDSTILYPTPELLLKETKIVTWRRYVSYAAAASIIYLLFLNWPSQGSQVKTASNTTQKATKVDQKKTKSPVVESKISTDNLAFQDKNKVVEHVDLGPNDTRDCIVQEVFPEAEQIPIEQSMYLSPPIINPIEFASVNPNTETNNKVNSVKSNEPIGIREFVVQKGNERLFGTANPSVSERYSSIANYMAKTTNIPINYEQRSTEKEEITYVRLGFISIERKRVKK